MIDLSRMKGIRIDPIRRVARAEPGLTWGEFDHETQALGLAVTGGIQSTTGIAGLTLGGGFGYLARKHGLTCDNLLSADVVTAEGERVTASPAENADLFWGLRGGGGNFGIVTSFEFRLHPLGPVLGGRLVYPLAQAREVLQFFRERSPDEPEEMFSIASFATAPVIQSIPEELRGMTVLVLIICYAGATEEGERHLKPLRTFLPPAVDTISMTPYTSMQTLLDAANPPHWNNYWKAEFLDDLPDRAIDLLIDFATRAPSAMSKVLIPHLGGAISRVPLHDTAYVHRGAPFIVNINAMWANSEDSERNMAWAKDGWAALQPFSMGGAYVNFLGDEGEERVKAAYGAETYRRLVELKNKYDPANFFRLNQNIRPTV
jgi:FAD/FMN-containing dehydrogenase